MHTVSARFTFKPGKKQEFLDILNGPDGLAVTRACEGFVSIDLYQSTEDENTLVAWQKWQSQENHTAYLNLRKESGLFTKLEEMLAEPLAITHLTSLSA